MMLPLLLASTMAFPKVRADAPITVNVLVINYDPIIEREGGKRLHEVMHWNDPRQLTDGYIADVKEASGGYVNLVVREWRDLDEWPKKKDGFRYTDASYLAVMRDKTEPGHQPDDSDYEGLIAEQKLIPLIDSGKIDEVWWFAFPYGGFWESAMAGPDAFFINGGVYDKVPSKRRFAIMGFNYERGVAEMIHDLSHRTENCLARAYGRWNPGIPQNMWERFSAYEKSSPGYAGVGNCHFPPNAEKDYDYANPRTVSSSADDWYRYPNLTGAKKAVDRETWGGPDYQRNYLRWWFAHMPKKAGRTPDGREMNWWKYVFQFNDYDAKGLPIRAGRK